MTFLKKIGQILMRAGQIAIGFSPIIQQLYPQSAGVINKISSELELFSQLAVTVEAIGVASQLTGPQKLSALTPLIAQAILQSDMMIKHKINDPALFNKAAQEFAQATVDLLNSLHENAAGTESKTV